MTFPKKGFRLIQELDPDHEVIVAMCEFDGLLYVATDRRVLRLHKSREKLVPIPIEIEDTTT